MENQDKGKEKKTPIYFEEFNKSGNGGSLKKRSLSDEIESSLRSTLPIKLPRRLKRSSMESVLDQFSMPELRKFDPYSNDFQLPLQSLRSPMNKECALLSFPDEIVLLIIYQMLKEINFDIPDPDDINDLLHSKEIHKTVLPFLQTCSTIKNLIPEGICTFYLIKLDQYLRSQKIQLAQDSYSCNHLKSVSYILTSLLRESDCDELLSKNIFLQRLVSGKLISIKNNCICFKLSDNEDENLNLLTKILLVLESLKDQFISINTIFETTLSSPHNQKTLNYLVNLEGLIPNKDIEHIYSSYEDELYDEELIDNLNELAINDYITTQLMIDCFNGNIDAFSYASDNNPQELYTETQRNFNAIIWAIIGGKPELLEYIFTKISLDILAIPNSLNQNLVHYATLYGSAETLEYIMSQFRKLDFYDSIINLENNNHQSPLSLAISGGFEDKTLILINSSASIELLNVSTLPTYEGESEMLKGLIENKDILRAVSKKLNINNPDQDLSIEDIISCCRQCKKSRTRLVYRIFFALGSVLTIAAYGLEKI